MLSPAAAQEVLLQELSLRDLWWKWRAANENSRCFGVAYRWQGVVWSTFVCFKINFRSCTWHKKGVKKNVFVVFSFDMPLKWLFKSRLIFNEDFHVDPSWRIIFMKHENHPSTKTTKKCTREKAWKSREKTAPDHEKPVKNVKFENWFFYTFGPRKSRKSRKGRFSSSVHSISWRPKPFSEFGS